MIKTTLTALALTIASALSAAATCSGHEARMTCADGMVFDAESGNCKVVSG